MARLRHARALGETEVPVQAWGPGGEPLIGTYRNGPGNLAGGKTLTDANGLQNYECLETSLYCGNPCTAAQGWSVRITHPNGTTEVRAVGAWLPTPNGTLRPLVPGIGEYAGALVPVGEEYEEPSDQFSTSLIPPEIPGQQ